MLNVSTPSNILPAFLSSRFNLSGRVVFSPTLVLDSRAASGGAATPSVGGVRSLRQFRRSTIPCLPASRKSSVAGLDLGRSREVGTLCRAGPKGNEGFRIFQFGSVTVGFRVEAFQQEVEASAVVHVLCVAEFMNYHMTEKPRRQK